MPARRRLTRFVYYLVEVLLGPGSAGTPSPVAGKLTPLGSHLTCLLPWPWQCPGCTAWMLATLRRYERPH